jgi:hypothetical protein
MRYFQADPVRTGATGDRGPPAAACHPSVVTSLIRLIRLIRTRHRVDPDLRTAATVVAWIGVILLVDAVSAGPGALEWSRQIGLGLGTWLVLVLLLRSEPGLVRAQTLIVVGLATIVEYTFSPLLEAYTYRIGTVPGFVPPGHGLVYLAALAIGRSRFLRRHARAAVTATVVAGTGWAGYGLLLAPLAGGRRDVLGVFWFACLLGFLRWGPPSSRLLYVGAFVVVSYLELVGTALGTWRWAVDDPVLHVIGQGNPPSGAAGGYGWFDLWAGLLAPSLVRALSAASWRRPLVARASPPNGPSTPASEVNRPPASTTIGTSAAMSYTSSSGSQATSTAPSASSMYDQKSP